MGLDRLIVYDFDGVIAESEVLANTVLATFKEAEEITRRLLAVP